MDEAKTLNHSKWECKYHVVFIPETKGVRSCSATWATETIVDGLSF